MILIENADTKWKLNITLSILYGESMLGFMADEQKQTEIMETAK